MQKLRARLGEETWTSWIAPITCRDLRQDEGRLLLSVPNSFYLRWIEKRYMSDLTEAFSEALDRQLIVAIAVESPAPLVLNGSRSGGNGSAGAPAADLFTENGFDPTEEAVVAEAPEDEARPLRGAYTPLPDLRVGRMGVPAEEVESPRDGALPPPPRLNPRFVFEDFVVGESNRYANAAALAVADPNAKAFNPLFIYGGSGLGKTHLMQAIGARMHQRDKALHVVYVTSEQFINTFIDAIQNRRYVEFRNAFRKVDLLLIDDVQFLMGKERTQQEFFHTFNDLYDAGKKVVVTSDRPPRDLSALEERLRSRFEWGLLVDIQPPDLETRIAILRRKAQQEGIRLPNDVILFIAERVTQNVREMEGALKRLRMTSSLHGKEVDLETARNVLSHLMHGSAQPRVSIEDVQRAVCAYFGIRLGDLLGKNRSKKFSQPRHLAQYLSRKLTDFSFPDIAQKFGGKDHTSIIYACRKVENMIQKDPNMANVVNYLTKQVTKGGDSG